MTRVVFRPAARADLIEIALHVSVESTDRARALITRLRRRCDILKSSAEAGRLRSEFGDGVRSLVERPYVILYRLNGRDAEILAILHGARDLPSVMRDRTGS